MLTDCAAMTVDCITYFFNFWAERLKHKHTITNENNNNNNNNGDQLSAYERQYQKKMRLLLLELAPPFISVSTLAAVTVIALKQAIEILLDTSDPTDNQQPPDLFLMLLFSGINFVLDGVNVLCFARANQAKGLPEGMTAVMNPSAGYVTTEQAEKCPSHHHSLQKKEKGSKRDGGNETMNEMTGLLSTSSRSDDTKAPDTVATTVSEEEAESSDDDDNNSTSHRGGLNLNMCSAWTHICADTLRSIAVLVAAGFAFLFPNLLTPANADSWGAIVVSIVIIISLMPLVEGLYVTAWEIYNLYKEHERRVKSEERSEHPGEVIVMAV